MEPKRCRRPYELTRSRYSCTRKSWRVSVLASRVVSTELIPPVLYVPAKSSQGARKLIVTKPHLLFSFCARVGWRDVCTEFTNLIKVDVDVNGCHYQIFNLRNIREIHLFDRYVFILLTKMRIKTKTVPSNWYFFNVQRCTHSYFHGLISLLVYMRNRRIFTGKSEALPSWLAICLLFLVVLSLVGLVTTQILICENQIIWRLEIPLRTIVAALIKINCNGRFV